MRIPTRMLLLSAGLVALAGAFVTGQGWSTPAEAGGTAVVLISPANQSVPVGTQVDIDVTLSDFPDPDGLGAYEFALTWDPNVLDFNCATAACTDNFVNGPLLGSTGRMVNCLPVDFDADNDMEDDPGYARVGCITFGEEPPGPTADGLLATLHFDTFCAGSTTITFNRVTLSDPLAVDEIPVNISGANATVTGAPPCAAGGLVGDANCNGVVNAIDAALILQYDAGLLNSIPCPDEADVNGSGGADALDALLVLQYDAGLLPNLPP